MRGWPRAALVGLCLLACATASLAEGIDGRWDAAVLLLNNSIRTWINRPYR
jgi:hypothetical protein